MLEINKNENEYWLIFKFEGKECCIDASAKNVEMKAQCLLEIGAENLKIQIIKREVITFDLEQFKKERARYEKADEEVKREEQKEPEEREYIVFRIGEGINQLRYFYDVTGFNLATIHKVVKEGAKIFDVCVKVGAVILHKDDTKTYMSLEEYKNLVRIRNNNKKEGE